MYSSIKPWLTTQATLLPFVAYSGEGDKTFATALPILVYPVGEYKLITDVKGKEVVSQTQLYIDGTTNINDSDEIIFESKQYEIKNRKPYYRKGIIDYWVVYI